MNRFRSFICALALTSAFTHLAYAASRVKTLRLSDKSVITLPVSSRGAVISLPTKPTNVALGSSSSFSVKYIKNDLVFAPMESGARSNLFIYLDGRRFNLDLVSKPHGYTLVIIKDDKSQTYRTKYED